MRIHWYLCCSILLTIISNSLFGQSSEVIRSDRPGQANSPFSIGKSVFQTQTGIDYHTESIGTTVSNWLAPNTVLRFGISKTIDLNSTIEYRFQETTRADTTNSSKGFSSVAVGARIHLYEGKPKQPKIGAQINMLLPNKSNAFKQKTLNPAFKLIIGQSLGSRFSYLINLGSNYDVSANSFNHSYIINIGYTINKSLSTFIENYGFINGTNHINKWDTGLAYIVNNNLQLDIYGGYYKLGNRQDSFISMGFSWRIICKKNLNKPQN